MLQCILHNSRAKGNQTLVPEAFSSGKETRSIAARSAKCRGQKRYLEKQVMEKLSFSANFQTEPEVPN
jgi:hypothetical protein